MSGFQHPNFIQVPLLPSSTLVGWRTTSAKRTGLVVLTRVVTLVVDRLKRQWLLKGLHLVLETNCIRQPASQMVLNISLNIC